MKEKKLKKLAKLIHKEIRSNDYAKVSKEPESYIHESDEETSDKFFNFVCNLLKLQGKLIINVTSEQININGDLDQFKPKSSHHQNNNSSLLKAEPSDLEVIINMRGFRINRGWSSRVSYKDDKIFQRLLPDVIEKQKIINKENINEMIDDIMVLTKLSRENNLDELLS